MSETPYEREYYSIVATVEAFDQRLLTVKSWGVTLSLAALAWGFQDQRYGLFLVSALSAVGFWLIESSFKRHQMRFYPRLREIERAVFAATPEADKALAAPRVNWSWATALDVYAGRAVDPEPQPIAPSTNVWWTFVFLHVALPHALTALVGLVLLALAHGGWLGPVGPTAWRW